MANLTTLPTCSVAMPAFSGVIITTAFAFVLTLFGGVLLPLCLQHVSYGDRVLAHTSLLVLQVF